MMVRSSFRHMAYVSAVTRGARAGATAILNHLPAPLTRIELQGHVNRSGFMLRNARTLHTSVIRKRESSHEEKTVQQESENKLTLKERLKVVVEEYGTTAIVFHVCISLTSLGLCYAAVKSGIDVQAALQKIGVNPNVSESTVATEASTFVVAYGCHKVFAPVRMIMTITCTPLIVKKLRSMGIIKHPVKQ